MAAWLVYAVLVALLVGGAAWLAERGARALGRPTRGAWVVGMGVSALVPLVAWLHPGPAGPPTLAAVPGAYVLETLPAVALPADGAGWSAERMLLVAWLSATGLLLAGLGWLVARLELRRRRWLRRVVDGVPVLVSRDTGPAALGPFRGRIVVPEWVLGMEPAQRRLLVRHEAEHVRAGDPQLALAALVLCALAPWNLPLWWQLRRLRLAIEVDCDARVMRGSGDPRSYGALLLAVGRRRAGPALALVESRTALERRLRMIMRGPNGRGTWRGIGFLAVAGVALAVACEAPAPSTSGASAEGTAAAGLTGVPLPGEGQLGTDGCAVVFLDGERSSREALDALAPEGIDRVEVLKGESVPADLGLEPDCAVIRVFTKAGARSARREAAERLDAAAARTAAPSSAVEPAFTPMTEPPRLTNGEETAAALEELYPPLLREAGIGGTANLWFYIDATGRVVEVRVNRSSGRDELDAAALKAAERMEFNPARNGEKAVPVWVALDVRFAVE